MYRNKKHSDDSSSDDGFPTARKYVRTEQDEKVEAESKTKKRLNIWSEVLQERELTEGISENLDIEGGGKKINRGVESYVLPRHRLDKSKCESRPVCHYADSPFDDAYLRDVDSPGVSKDLDETAERQDQNKQWRYKKSETGGRQGERQQPMRHSGRDRSAGFQRGDSRDRFTGRNCRKRAWSDRKTCALVSKDYSLEALMAAELPSGLPIDELSKRIAKALGERDGSSIIAAVKAVGETLALKLFEEARNVEASGGMLVVNGSRRRTPGGVFLALFKANPDVPQAAKDAMNDMQKAFLREMKKAKRRGGGFTEVSVTSSHFALQVHSIAFVSALLSHIVTFFYRVLCVFMCMRYLCLRAFISVPLCVLVVAILWS
uniref:Phosphorylated adapter RNA export protein n=1 Tax=Ascaris lumbricoides TaxID=6252 RepID=A0A0M3ICG8_ASCLU